MSSPKRVYLCECSVTLLVVSDKNDTKMHVYPLTHAAGTADDNLSSLSSLFKALSGFAQEYFCTLARSDTAVLIPQNQQKQALELCSSLKDSFEQIINSKIVAVELHANIQYARRPLPP